MTETMVAELTAIRSRVKQHRNGSAVQMLDDLIRAVELGDIDEMATDYELERRDSEWVEK